MTSEAALKNNENIKKSRLKRIRNLLSLKAKKIVRIMQMIEKRRREIAIKAVAFNRNDMFESRKFWLLPET